MTSEVIPAPSGSERLYSYIPHIEQSYSVEGLNTGSLYEAIDIWNISIGRQLLSLDKGGFPIYIKLVDEINLDVVTSSNEEHVDAVSYRYLDTCVIEMKKCGESVCYLEDMVLVHELGHCIGFAHSINPQSIMYPTLNTSQHITSAIIDLINAESLTGIN